MTQFDHENLEAQNESCVNTNPSLAIVNTFKLRTRAAHTILTTENQFELEIT